MSTSSLMVIEFAKSTENVCLLVASSMFLIILFIMTPLNKFILSSILGKLIVIIILGYALYYNINKTNKFSTNFNISLTSGNWDALKTNITCSYIYSLCLLVLLISVVKKIL